MFWRKSGLYSTYEQKCSDQRSISIYYLMATTPRLMWGPTWVICVHSVCSITREQLVLITCQWRLADIGFMKNIKGGQKWSKGDKMLNMAKFWKHTFYHIRQLETLQRIWCWRRSNILIWNVETKNDWTANDFSLINDVQQSQYLKGHLSRQSRFERSCPKTGRSTKSFNVENVKVPHVGHVFAESVDKPPARPVFAERSFWRDFETFLL